MGITCSYPSPPTDHSVRMVGDGDSGDSDAGDGYGDASDGYGDAGDDDKFHHILTRI